MSVSTSLHRLVFELDRSADEMLRAQFGITYSRAIILVVLQDNPRITQHQLAGMLGHTDPAVSSLLVGLIADGHVERHPNPVHGKKYEVSLTPSGDQLISQARQFLDERFDALLSAAGVDGAEYGRLTDQLLNTIVQKEG